jgi:hypothetical protein
VLLRHPVVDVAHADGAKVNPGGQHGGALTVCLGTVMLEGGQALWEEGGCVGEKGQLSTSDGVKGANESR